MLETFKARGPRVSVYGLLGASVFFLPPSAMGDVTPAQLTPAQTEQPASPSQTKAPEPAPADTAKQAPSPEPPKAPTTAASHVEAPTVEVLGYSLSIGSADAASQGSVSGEYIDLRPVLRPGEVLEYVPGMVVTQHSGDGKANQYFLRGFNLDHGTDFATTVDGVPVNMPTHAHGQGYMDLNFLVPELVQRMDFQKGPYYAAYGDFATVGAADIYYYQGLEQNMADLTVGSYQYLRGLVAASKVLGQSSSASQSTQSSPLGGAAPTLLGAVVLQHQDGPWVVPEDLNKFDGMLRLSDGSSARGWSMDGIFYKAHWNSTDQVPLTLIEDGTLCRFCALDPTDGGNTGRAILSGEYHDTEDNGYWKALVYYEYYNLQLWSDFTFFENRCALAPDPSLPCDQFEQWENRNILGTKLSQGWYHFLFGHDSNTEIGLQLRYDNIHVGLDNTQSRVVFQSVRDDFVNELGSGVYVQNNTVWTSWFRSVFGLRFDRVDNHVDATLTPENTGTSDGHAVSPKMSLIFGPWNRTEYFVNYGWGFHTNDARGTTQILDPTTGLASIPTPAIVREKGGEVGARTNVIPNFQSSLAFWTLYSDSEIEYAADSDIGSTEPTGATRRYGVEWNNQWAATPWLLFNADLAWIHARYAYANANDSAGYYVPNAVSAVVTFGATVKNLGPWSGGLIARYFSSYPLTQDGSLWAPSSFTVDVRGQYAVSSHVSLALDFLNLFNKNNYDIQYAQ
ncbi:MAG TPA: TonB-dependent receptor, partial [Burkholderiales bacterium]|nr:TonB-dependent receptor [Burkholderiales bacterium]